MTLATASLRRSSEATAAQYSGLSRLCLLSKWTAQLILLEGLDPKRRVSHRGLKPPWVLAHTSSSWVHGRPAALREDALELEQRRVGPCRAASRSFTTFRPRGLLELSPASGPFALLRLTRQSASPRRLRARLIASETSSKRTPRAPQMRRGEIASAQPCLRSWRWRCRVGCGGGDANHDAFSRPCAAPARRPPIPPQHTLRGPGTPLALVDPRRHSAGHYLHGAPAAVSDRLLEDSLRGPPERITFAISRSLGAR